MQNTNTAREAPLRSFRITVPEPAQSGVAALLEAEGFRFEPEPFRPAAGASQPSRGPLDPRSPRFSASFTSRTGRPCSRPWRWRRRRARPCSTCARARGARQGFWPQLVGPGGFVLANEVSHSRLFTLRQNLRVCNFLQAGTCSYEGQHIPLAPGSLRYIQLDPPCSGWGTAVKNPEGHGALAR